VFDEPSGLAKRRLIVGSMCQGVVAAWRNPRAHSSQFVDTPMNALMMLEHVQHLMGVTKSATRTRRRRPGS
jgi:hypothetical protein